MSSSSISMPGPKDMPPGLRWFIERFACCVRPSWVKPTPMHGANGQSLTKLACGISPSVTAWRLADVARGDTAGGSRSGPSRRAEQATPRRDCLERRCQCDGSEARKGGRDSGPRHFQCRLRLSVSGPTSFWPVGSWARVEGSSRADSVSFRGAGCGQDRDRSARVDARGGRGAPSSPCLLAPNCRFWGNAYGSQTSEGWK